MRKTTHIKILKGSEVKVEGKFTLDVTKIEQDSPKNPSMNLVEPQVRVLQSESEFSIIEITCSCGELLNLRCEYAAAKTPEVPKQSVESQVTNQEKTEGEKNDAN